MLLTIIEAPSVFENLATILYCLYSSSPRDAAEVELSHYWAPSLTFWFKIALIRRKVL